MPIEFRCPNCSKLLRTPDESAGKKAKCPQCGGIADVPLTSVPAAGGSNTPGMGMGGPAAPLPPSMPMATGGIPPNKPPLSPFDTAGANPYASPGPAFSTPSADLSRSGLTPTRISFDRIFDAVWAVFKPAMSQMAVFGLVIMGANVILQIIGQGGGAAAQATREPVIFVGFTIINTLFGMVAQMWLNIGSSIYMLKAARNEQPSINDLGAAGPFFLRAILMQIIVTLISAGILAVCLAPAGILLVANRDRDAAIIAAGIGGLIAAVPLVYLFYSWFLGLFFIVDRNLSATEALAESRRFMSGNRLITFLILLVVGFVGSLFGILTCCIGFILVVPYMALLNTTIYLSATGQPIPAASANRM